MVPSASSTVTAEDAATIPRRRRPVALFAAAEGRIRCDFGQLPEQVYNLLHVAYEVAAGHDAAPRMGITVPAAALGPAVEHAPQISPRAQSRVRAAKPTSMPRVSGRPSAFRVAQLV